jgi:serine/threonine-protein kinase
MQTPFAIGERIGGKYRVESVIGEGGMGIVLAARHEALDLRVAVKLLREVGDDRAGARFLREARLAARLRSAYAVRVHDFGVERETPYIVMELLSGAPLRTALAGGRLPASEAVDHVIDVCIALAEGHELGIVHRDVKPSNVFLERRADGSIRARLVDFGIAKPHTLESTLTENDTSLGTPQYMAPEQMRDARRVDARADLWSLGVVLYESLSGALPFEGYTPAGYLASVLADEPAPLASRVPDIAPALAAVVARCLEKDPSKRLASATELAALLAPFGGPDARARAGETARVAAETRARKDDRDASPAPLVAKDSETVTATRGEWATHPASDAVVAAAPRKRSIVVPLAIGAVLIVGAAVAFVSRAPSAPVVDGRAPEPSSPVAVPSAPSPVASPSASSPAAAVAVPSVSSSPPLAPSVAPARPTPATPPTADKPRPKAPAALGVEITEWGNRK